jgi:hypothetical protein
MPLNLANKMSSLFRRQSTEVDVEEGRRTSKPQTKPQTRKANFLAAESGVDAYAHGRVSTTDKVTTKSEDEASTMVGAISITKDDSGSGPEPARHRGTEHQQKARPSGALAELSRNTSCQPRSQLQPSRLSQPPRYPARRDRCPPFVIQDANARKCRWSTQDSARAEAELLDQGIKVRDFQIEADARRAELDQSRREALNRTSNNLGRSYHSANRCG